MRDQEHRKKLLRRWLIAIPAVLVSGTIVLVAYLASSPKTLDKLAQPALNRNSQNTARQNDANMIASAVVSYATSHNGNLPQTTGTGATVTSLDICGANCASDDKETTTLAYYKPSAVRYHAYAANIAVPNNTVYIVNNARCNVTNDGIGDQTSASQPTAIVLYGVQSGSGTQQKCLSP